MAIFCQFSIKFSIKHVMGAGRAGSKEHTFEN